MKKLLCLLLCMILLASGCEVKKMDDVTSAEDFAREYSVSTKNPFVYASLNDVYDILEDGTGIIFFGNSDCDVCNVGAKTITDVLIKNKIKEAYYYNPKNIMDENGKEYKKLIKLINEDSDEEINFDIPSVFIVKDGKVIGYNSDLGTLKNEDIDLALDSDTKKDLKNKYNELIVNFRKQ